MVLRAQTTNQRFFVRDHSYVGAARRGAREFAEGVGLVAEPLERLSLVVSELASNLSKHSQGGGEILVCDASDEFTKRVRVFAIDHGPGIDCIDEALQDGVSTTATLGGGFGAMRRLTESFELGSCLGQGTVVLATIAQTAAGKKQPGNENLELGFVCVPHPKESSCGDAVATKSSHEMLSIMLIDSLGHGEAASQVSQMASRVFLENAFMDLPQLLDLIQAELRGSRGAAIALTQIIPSAEKVLFLGVGNISSRIIQKYSTKGCSSVQGIVGGSMSSPKMMEYDWARGAALLMYSDGIKSAAQIKCCTANSANLLAAEVYRDYSRASDDASVVVVKDMRSK